MSTEETPTPLWKKAAAGGVAVISFVIIALTWNRLGADFWPLDRSFVGPNIVASLITWVFVLVIGALLWPPTRRRLHRFMDRKLAPLHETLARHEKMHEDIKASLDSLHAKHDEDRRHRP